ncbi:MAG TPA: putative glycolipid-binding domain-containing protein, partial [Thermoanaerobaculia bacterium]
LAVGSEATVRAAWLRFPSFRLEPLEQTYRRTAPSTWRYESAGGRFARDLTVREDGFVTSYPDFWVAEGRR